MPYSKITHLFKVMSYVFAIVLSGILPHLAHAALAIELHNNTGQPIEFFFTPPRTEFITPSQSADIGVSSFLFDTYPPECANDPSCDSYPFLLTVSHWGQMAVLTSCPKLINFKKQTDSWIVTWAGDDSSSLHCSIKRAKPIPLAVTP
jgi:hypothetical protein